MGGRRLGRAAATGEGGGGATGTGGGGATGTGGGEKPERVAEEHV